MSQFAGALPIAAAKRQTHADTFDPGVAEFNWTHTTWARPRRATIMQEKWHKLGSKVTHFLNIEDAHTSLYDFLQRKNNSHHSL